MKGMMEALRLGVLGSSDLQAYSFAQMTDAIGLLLARGAAAGRLRSDTGPEEFLRTLAGVFYVQSTADWLEQYPLN